MRTNTKTETKKIVMSYDNFESAIVSFLYATKTIPENYDVTFTDFGISLNDDGMVEFDVEVVKPVRSHLKVVGEEQMELPFDTFETVHVADS